MLNLYNEMPYKNYLISIFRNDGDSHSGMYQARIFEDRKGDGTEPDCIFQSVLLNTHMDAVILAKSVIWAKDYYCINEPAKLSENEMLVLKMHLMEWPEHLSFKRIIGEILTGNYGDKITVLEHFEELNPSAIRNIMVDALRTLNECLGRK